MLPTATIWKSINQLSHASKNVVTPLTVSSTSLTKSSGKNTSRFQLPSCTQSTLTTRRRWSVASVGWRVPPRRTHFFNAANVLAQSAVSIWNASRAGLKWRGNLRSLPISHLTSGRRSSAKFVRLHTPSWSETAKPSIDLWTTSNRKATTCCSNRSIKRKTPPVLFT